jgi:hydrogenase/urease accessory protein HupE
MGGAVILGRQWPMSVMAPAVAAAGLAIGLDSAPDSSNDLEIWLAFSGLAFGFVVVATTITGLAIGLTKDWQRIGVRIAGSWIVAISMLVLALSIAAHPKPLPTAAALAAGRSPSC